MHANKLHRYLKPLSKTASYLSTALLHRVPNVLNYLFSRAFLCWPLARQAPQGMLSAVYLEVLLDWLNCGLVNVSHSFVLLKQPEVHLLRCLLHSACFRFLQYYSLRQMLGQLTIYPQYSKYSRSCVIKSAIGRFLEREEPREQAIIRWERSFLY